MVSGYRRYIVLLIVIGVTFACRGVMGLSDTPEGIANDFLRNLYQLNFEPLATIANDQALKQAALLEGHADAFTPAERQRYQHSNVLVTTFFHEEGTPRARADYTVTFQDGESLTNTLILEQRENKWQVVALVEPLITPQIYFYFEE